MIVHLIILIIILKHVVSRLLLYRKMVSYHRPYCCYVRLPFYGNLPKFRYDIFTFIMAKETFVLTFITNRGLFHLNDLSLLKRRNMDMSTKVYVFVTASCHKTHIFVLPKYFFSFFITSMARVIHHQMHTTLKNYGYYFT